MVANDKGNVYMVNEKYFEIVSIEYLNGLRVGMRIKAKFSGTIRIFGWSYNGTFGFEPVISTSESLVNYNNTVNVSEGTIYTLICRKSMDIDNASMGFFGTLT